MTGCGLPWPALASPPPCGWSTGFIAAPRTVGRDAAPALSAGLAELLEVVLVVADFADGGAAVDRHLAHFAGAKAQRGVAAVRGRSAATPAPAARASCAPLPGFISTQCTVEPTGDVAQRQRCCPVLDRRVACRRSTWSPCLQALGGDDVAALAVGIAQQRDVRGAVRVVFDPLDARRNAFLVALEVDDAVVLLVTTADGGGW